MLRFHRRSATYPPLNAEINVHDISICEKEKKEDRKRPCSIHIFMVFINLNVGGHLLSFVCMEMVVSALLT